MNLAKQSTTKHTNDTKKTFLINNDSPKSFFVWFVWFVYFVVAPRFLAAPRPYLVGDPLPVTVNWGSPRSPPPV